MAINSLTSKLIQDVKTETAKVEDTVEKAANKLAPNVTNELKKDAGWLGKAAAGEVKKAKDGFMNLAGAAVGYAELAGLRYPVKQYSAKLSAGLTRGSRIDTAPGYAQLKAEGYKGIVDLRAEGPGDSKDGATKAGLNAERIPIIDNTPPTTGQVKQFLDFVTNPKNEPAYVHCEAGVGRTGVMSAAYRMAAQGWPPEKALAEAKKMGCAMPDQQAFILQFGQDLAAGKIAGYPLHPPKAEV